MKTFLLSLTTLLLFSFVNGQSADDIIAKHIDAIGGKDKLSQITSIYIENKTEVMGNESDSKTTILNGKGYKNEMNFNGQQIVQVITDKGGWSINPFSGGTAAESIPADQYKSSEDQVYLPDPLFNYALHGAKVELEGQEKVDSINAYKIKYTNKDSAETTFYIDPTNWYIIRALTKGDVQGQETTFTISFSDMRKTDFGILIPYNTKIDMGQFALQVTATKVEINKDIDLAIFTMPK
jgi:hypothetical protein